MGGNRVKYDKNKKREIAQAQSKYNPIDIYVEQADCLTESDDLIEKNLRFALKMAHKYKGHGMDLEDLVQEANRGLVVAASKFDASKGNFFNYAKFYIRKFILTALTKTNGSVTEASGHKYTIRSIKRARQQLIEEGIKEPTISEIAAVCGKSERQVKFALSGQVQCIVRLDQPVGTDATNGGSQRDAHECISLDNLDADAHGYAYSKSPEAAVAANERRDMLEQMFSDLPDTERDIVWARLIDGKTLQEIGEDHGLTPTGVKNVVERGVCMLMDISKNYRSELA